MITSSPLLSVAQLATYLGLAEQTIYNRHHQGRDLPPTIKLGNRLLFDPADVREWIEGKKKKPCSETISKYVQPVRRRLGRPTKAESIARRKQQEIAR